MSLLARCAGRRPARGRRSVPALAGVALTLACAPGALADSSVSSNWAGYAVHRAGTRFQRVLGTWTQPSAVCTAGQATYSSVWVGIGGYRKSSRALEQIGSETDCSATGRVISSAWYELVPAGSRSIRMAVRPGDTLHAAVTVRGHRVRLTLRDLTRHRSFTKSLRASTVDVGSADWIVEAPSACSSDTACQTLPLADFVSTTISGAVAETTRGVTGTISDRAWDASRITLASTAGRHFVGAAGAGVSASPSSLASRGAAFTVTYRGPSAAIGSSTSLRRAGVRAGGSYRALTPNLR